MRFNSIELLKQWKTTGRWPAIHDDMSDMAVTYLRGKRLVDLGCAYGLLGARIALECGLSAPMGIDASADLIAAGRGAGLAMVFRQLDVNRETMPELMKLIKGHGADIVIARRILPELFGADLEMGPVFAEALRANGVKEILLQGRAVTNTAVNPLRSVTEETRLLLDSYRTVAIRGSVAYLVAR